MSLCSYDIDGNVLQTVDKVADLGFFICRSLTFGEHINMVVSKATNKVGKRQQLLFKPSYMSIKEKLLYGNTTQIITTYS
ncbi:unnamed protein product [Haemonchus placei]|uniref:DNA-directed RNA polymerase n=1 Tax=Haemonchus placei TaxID=6290 RepID=A0A0N4WND3_HAEPC|nr:unnamed protein product [Haemonchus placei]